MNSLKSSLCALFLAAPLLFGEIQYQTSINDVYFRGDDELVGSVLMRVTDDDFASASTAEPIFMRVTLDHNAVLAHTLVDLTGGQPDLGLPLFLAMYLTSESEADQLNAPGHSVSIVRWVQGESHFWIRVQSSSSNWVLEQGAAPAPPSEARTVSWLIGVSARRSASYEEGRAKKNLPFNTRNPDADPSSPNNQDAVSTLICVDLSAANLAASGVESLLNGGHDLVRPHF